MAAAKVRAAELKALRAQAELELAAAELQANSEATEQTQERQRQRERAQAARLKKQADERAARKAARARAAAAAQPDEAAAVVAQAVEPAAVVAPAAPPVRPNNDPPVDDYASDDEFHEDEEGEYIDEPIDETHAETGKRRKRIGLHCFSCNRREGHTLSHYRKMWYSYIVGMTFGLSIFFGPYRCQCCGSNRLMISNLLNPRYYFSMLKTKSGSSSRRSSRRR